MAKSKEDLQKEAKELAKKMAAKVKEVTNAGKEAKKDVEDLEKAPKK